MPLWDVELAAAEIQRNADRGVRAFCFTELPHHLKLPTIHSGGWDKVFQVCNDTGVTLCMHIGSSSTNPAGVARHAGGVGGTLRSTTRWRRWPTGCSRQLIEFPKLKLAHSEGQIGWIPCALERADTVGQARRVAALEGRIPNPPSTYYYAHLRLLHRRPPRLHSLAETGEDNICFETDYPHTDTTWPNSKEYIEKMLADFDDDVAYKVLRQRDPDAGARSGWPS
jgi:predicted TIM-barrel fold metal-dependent hydrolase